MRKALDALPDEVLRTRIREVLSADVSVALGRIEKPILYLQATEDGVVSRAAGAKFARLARRGSIETIVGPHCLLQCVPIPAARAIERFIRGLQSGV